MIHLDDIHSLTDFQRHAKEHIERLKETGRPEVLTVNGKAEVVVQDAAAYQKLLELVDRLQAIEGIQKGLESMQRGEGQPAQEVFTRLRKKHNMDQRAHSNRNLRFQGFCRSIRLIERVFWSFYSTVRSDMQYWLAFPWPYNLLSDKVLRITVYS
jgi:PHD/YefM family antitoxin component YafN of YafNO toxin-antitoxin module